MQRRRVHMASGTIGAGAQQNLVGTVDETNGANVHGIRCSFITEPQNADANANGVWAVWCLPDELTSIPTTSVGAMELEGSNAFLWGCGIWASSNQTPFCLDVPFGTSRNCQNGARIVLVIHASGVSAGVVQVTTSMCYFTKSL